MGRIKQNQSGFTVLEVAVSIVLAGMLIIALVVMVNNLNTVNDRARDLTITSSFIENKIEALRNESFLALPADAEVVNFTTEMPDTLAKPRSATYLVTDLNVALNRLDFTISYNDHGHIKTVNYSTAIGDLGVGQY